MKLSKRSILLFIVTPLVLSFISIGLYWWKGADWGLATPVVEEAPLLPMQNPVPKIPASIQDSLYKDSLLDEGYFKSSTLEALLNEKATRIIRAHLVDPTAFRVNTTIFFRPQTEEDTKVAEIAQANQIEQIKKTEEEKKEIQKQAEKTDPTDEVTLGRNDLFSLDAVVTRYKKQMELKENNPLKVPETKVPEIKENLNPRVPDLPANIEVASDSSGAEEDLEDSANEEAVAEEPQYVITEIYLTANFSKTISADQVKLVQKDLQEALGPTFGKVFRLSVNQVDLSPVAPGWLNRWNEIKAYVLEPYKMVFLSLFLALIGTFLFSAILNFMSERQALLATMPKKMSPAELEAAAKAAAQKKEREQAEAEAARKAEEQKQHLFALEQEIVRVAVREKKAVKHLMLDWSSSDDHTKKLIVLMDILARNRIEYDRTPLGIDKIREIRKEHNFIAGLSYEDRSQILAEINWSLVATSLLGDRTAEPSLSVASGLSDVMLKRFLADEDYETQGAVLLSLNEARAAKLFGGFTEERRAKVMEEICLGRSAQPELIEKAAVKLETLMQKRQDHPFDLPDQDAGVASLTAIVKGLDFEAQFAAGKGLLSMSASVLGRFLSHFFNVCLVPFATDEFLQTLVESANIKALQAMVGEFGDEFKQRLVPFLPPMQKTIIESTVIPMPKAERMGHLKALNEEVNQKIEGGKIAYSDIYDFERLQKSNRPKLKMVPDSEAA